MLLTRRSVILAKVESAYGTDPTPTVADNTILGTVPVVSMDAQKLDRFVTIGTLSPTKPISGRKLMNGSFSTELKSQANILAGDDTSPIEVDPLLRMAGFVPSYTEESSGGADDGYVEYSLVSDDFESSTLYIFTGKEVLHKIPGAFANLSFDLVAGQYGMMNVEAKGLYVKPTDTTAGSPDPAEDDPVMIESLSLSFGAISDMVIRSLSVNLNNNITERADVNSNEGLYGIRISDRNPEISFTLEKPLVADWDIYDALDVATSYNTTCTVGSSDGQKIDFTMPNLSITDIQESEENGIVMLNVTGQLNRDSDDGNDELTLKFY